MDNNANQVMEIETEEVGLFDDLVEETTESTPAEEVTESKPEETTPAEVPAEPFLKIKYNKEEKGLTQQEAVELSQKGMNYDKVLGQYNTLNDRLNALAKSNNMDVEAYLKSLDEAQHQFEIDRELQALKQQYPTADEGLLKEIAANRATTKRNEQQKAANETQAKEEATNQDEIARQVEIFNKRYPNLKADELDGTVYDLMKEGYTLLEAYTIFKEAKEAELKKAEEEKAAVAKQNEANKRRSLGNISNTGSNDYDDFMSGFSIG